MRFVKQINQIEVCFYADLYVHIPSIKTVVFSDLHMAKAGHFRKNGIPFPSSIHQDEMELLNHMINLHQPQKVIITGDLMHSRHNAEFDLFYSWVSENSNIQFVLTAGNHDIDLLPYNSLPKNLETCEVYRDQGFAYAHEHQEHSADFMFSGHIHPIIRLRGKGRQSQQYKAFILHKQYCLMPSLGFTTFGKSIKLEEDEEALVALGNQLLQVDYASFSKINR